MYVLFIDDKYINLVIVYLTPIQCISTKNTNYIHIKYCKSYLFH